FRPLRRTDRIGEGLAAVPALAEQPQLALECSWRHGKRGGPALADGVVTEEDGVAHRDRIERVALRRARRAFPIGDGRMWQEPGDRPTRFSAARHWSSS